MDSCIGQYRKWICRTNATKSAKEYLDTWRILEAFAVGEPKIDILVPFLWRTLVEVKARLCSVIIMYASFMHTPNMPHSSLP